MKSAAMTTLTFLALAAAATAPSMRCIVWAQDGGAREEVSDEQNRKWAEYAAQLAAIEAAAYEIHLKDASGPQLELADKPALKWSNNDDATIHGSVIVWTHEGRPKAIGSFFKFFTAKDEFSAELHSLAEGPLVAAKGGNVVWQPNEAGVTFTALDVAVPAKSAAARLVQMRGIARDFSGTMTTFQQTSHPLRLLPQPVWRYAEGGRHSLDGAIFVFARATDPDVLLVLEARGVADEAKWHYALARMHCGALEMHYRDRQVWTTEQLAHPFDRPKGPYTLLQGIPEPKTVQSHLEPD